MDPTSLQPCNSCIKTLIEELFSKKIVFFENIFPRHIICSISNSFVPYFLALMLGINVPNLALDYYFDHNLNFKFPNGECKLIFHTYFQDLLDGLKITQFEQCFIFTLIPSIWHGKFKFSK